MRISKTQRLLAAVLGTTFLVASFGEVLGTDLCPHHDWLPASSDAPAQHIDGGHGSAHQVQASSSHHGGSSHEGACTCIGDCLTNATSTPAVAVFTHRLFDLPGFGVAPVADSGILFRSAVPYRLPYANGPPQSV